RRLPQHRRALGAGGGPAGPAARPLRGAGGPAARLRLPGPPRRRLLLGEGRPGRALRGAARPPPGRRAAPHRGPPRPGAGADGPRRVRRGGCRSTNILVRVASAPDRVCILDWEEAAYGPPLLDLAYLLDGIEPPTLGPLLDAYLAEARAYGLALPPRREMK